ncbi:hypothetical protein Q9K01_11955 [Qipengyuania sp. DY56-A-20]|jgi:hypothetical protein|uniref:Uncharacterized protein n=1 Tax=Qipengyuania benthica TaxID=3067651 RepID=A0ABT9HAJ6_9SPHN|nr:hypothetical protein [Qipengyuania sp. DY56-A-20]MDP4540342.1 hypothetical protein [Qipengyuania sp. DY56-A-20]
MPPEQTTSVNGTDDNVLAAVAGILPKLPNVRAEDPDRFAQAARALVETRAQAGWPSEADADVAAFVMVDRPREYAARFPSDAIMDPIATQEPLLGRLFLMNRDCSAGRGLTLPCAPGNLLDWLSENGLGDLPVAVAYRTTSTMTVRREGVEDLIRPHKIRDRPPAATVEELLDALNHFHLSGLLTPTCCVPGVWEPKRAAKYVPGSQPERSIQDALALALGMWFQGLVRVGVEDRTNIGRIDVRLLKPSAEGQLAYWAIVELKVIKAFANAKGKAKAAAVSRTVNVDAIQKGLRQTWAYQSNRESEEGLLEIFDLREDKSEDLMADGDVVKLLGELAPVPRYTVRPLFGSSEHARIAGFSGV